MKIWLTLHIGKHGDYQGIKSWPNTIGYLMKEDPEPLAFGIDPQFLERCKKKWNSGSQRGKADTIVQALCTGEKTLRDILR